MNRIIKITSAAVFFLTSSLALACDYPDRPHIPDGATASKDELLAAKSAVQGYITAVDDYLQCIEDEETATIAAMEDPAPEEVQRHNDTLNKRFDAANEEKALVGEQFNQQIRAYNQKLKDSNQ